jgi:hypothetical protein
MGSFLFEGLSSTEKLSCNFYYSAVSPDHQVGAGMPPRSPGLRPNFQVQHLLCPACGLTFRLAAAGTRIAGCMGALACEGPRQQWTKRFWLRSRGDGGPGGNGNWNNQQDPDNGGNEGEDDCQGSGASGALLVAHTVAQWHYNSHISCSTTGAFSILNPVGGSRSLNPPSPLPPPPSQAGKPARSPGSEAGRRPAHAGKHRCNQE